MPQIPVHAIRNPHRGSPIVHGWHSQAQNVNKSEVFGGLGSFARLGVSEYPYGVSSKKNIVVGVCGSIAAYKSAFLVRELTRRGYVVRVAMTESARHFVGAMTFSGITGNPTLTDSWDVAYPGEAHVDLGTWADMMIIAPATRNLIAKMAAGLCEDAVLLTQSCLTGPTLLAPAMHSSMWNGATTQRNIRALESFGVHFVGPESGPLASGTKGTGRMSEPLHIADHAESILRTKVDLQDLNILITAGPTVEDLDPVRFFSNRSSGKMGFALASTARARGARVTLVSGPVSEPSPPGVTRVDVRSAREMFEAVTVRATSADVIIMAAAVADYRPKETIAQKIKKGEGPMTLVLDRNPDILAHLGQARSGPQPYLVGFALETENLEANSRKKLARKRCDLLVANLAEDSFGRNDNRATLITPTSETHLGKMSKLALAEAILSHIRSALTPKLSASQLDAKSS